MTASRHIAYLATAFSTNDDIEPQISDAWRLYMCLTTSKKPVVSGAFSENGVPRMAEMMQLFRADRAELLAKPMSIFTITATGNFRYGEDSCQNLLDCVEAGIPVEVVPVTLMGLIAPGDHGWCAGFSLCRRADRDHDGADRAARRAGVVRWSAGHLSHEGREFPDARDRSPAPRRRLRRASLSILGLPCQAYMGLTDAKVLDAQAGAETFASALLAAMAGVNSVSGPGMLDFVLTFSLPKLVFDNEVCGQVLHFVREIEPRDDLPTTELVRELIENDHLITSPHTLKHWPQELYLTDPVFDRENREAWEKAGSTSLDQRAFDGVERRLASYLPIETDPALDAELRRIVQSGMQEPRELPVLPPPPDPALAPAGPRKRRTGRRHSKTSTA